MFNNSEVAKRICRWWHRIACGNGRDGIRPSPKHADSISWSTASIFIIITFLLLGLSVQGTNAATFYVGTTTDEKDGGDCANSGNTDCSLREALDAANANSGADTISIPAGTFTLSLDGSDENANATGDLDILDGVTISGAGIGSTTVDASGLTTPDRVFHATYQASPFAVTVQDLKTTNGDAGSGSGGCMDTQNNNLTLTNVNFSGCGSTSHGNGGALNGNGATLTVSGSIFDNNHTGASGGAIYSIGAASSFTNTTISNNSAFTTGGGIYSNNAVTLTSSTVSGNSTTDTVTNGNGGGVLAMTSLDITDTTVSNNISTKNGGGAFLNSTNTMTVLRSTITGNKAKNSGGGLLTWNGTINVYNSTISGNNAAYNSGAGAGGGIYTQNCTIKSSTIYGNTRSWGGGGVHNDSGTCTIQNTIFKSNDTTCRNIADITSSGNNIDDKAEGVCFNAADGDTVNSDALLNALADNGGPTLTHSLQTGSPAIDTGDNTACAASPVSNVDQRGETRPKNGGVSLTCDIGAFEYIQGANYPPNQPKNTDPSNTETGVSVTPTLVTGVSDYSDPNSDTHRASQWQIRKSTGVYGDADSYDSSAVTDLTSHTVTNWSYKRTITLSPATSTADYQVKVVLTTANTNNYANMDTEGDDLRFEDASGAELSYWIETWNTSGDSTLWVKVPDSGTGSITMYYGNSAAAAVSNGDDVFELFDDFNDASLDTSKWETVGFTESGGTASGSSENEGWKYIRSITSFGSNVILETTVEVPSADMGGNGSLFAGLYDSAAGTPANTAAALPATDKHVGFGEGWCSDQRLCSEQANGTSREGESTSRWAADTHVIKASWYGSGASFVAGGYSNSFSTYPPTGTSLDVFLGVVDINASYGPIAMNVDYVRVRKYAASEPVATVGSEDTVSSFSLDNSTDYYWRVRYQDDPGLWSLWSDETIFTTISASTTVSGSVYTDEGTTKVPSEVTVRLLINGTDAQTVATTGGDYSFTASLAAGQPITVHIDNDGTYKATTVTVGDGNSLSGLHLYDKHLITRFDNGAGNLTNDNLFIADDGDDDILYIVSSSSGGNLNVEGTNTELFVWADDTFAPGGAIDAYDVDVRGTLDAANNAINVDGNWYVDAAGTFNSTGTVTFDGTADQTITSNLSSFNNLVLNNTGTNGVDDDIILGDALDVDGNLTVTDGVLDTTGSNFAVSVNGNLSDSATGRIKANGSNFTVGGNVSLNANNNVTESADFNSASLEMTGDGTQLSYANLDSFWVNGFDRLTVGAAGASTQLNNHLTVGSVLTVGSGALTGTPIVVLKGSPDPLDLDEEANVSVGTLAFLAGGASPSQNLTNLPNGYDCNISVSATGLTLNQTENVTINAPNSLLIKGDNVASRTVTYNTGGNNLSVGGNIELGAGSDTGTKTFNATNSTVSVGGNFTINHSSNVFTSTDSTVVLNGTADQTITSSGHSFINLTLNNTGASGSDDIIIADALDINGILTISDGDLDISSNNPTVNTAGNVSVGANGSIDVTSRTANWTFDGTSTLTDSSAGQDFEDVVLNGTSLTLGSNAKVKTMTVTAGTLNLGNSGYVLEINSTGTPLVNSGTFTAGTSTVKYSGSGAATNITALPYSSLQLAPASATTYSLTNHQTGGNALTGNLIIDNNATLTTTAGNYNITLAGNWNNSGTFTGGSSTVTFNGTNQSITGSNTFYNFSVADSTDNGSDVTLTFEAGQTQTISNTLTLDGLDLNDRVNLRSSSSPTRFTLNVASPQTVDFVDVQDSNASGSDITATDSYDRGNNDTGEASPHWVISGGANNPPDTPTNGAVTNVESLRPTLNASPYYDPEGDDHQASQWQIRKSTGTYGDADSYDTGPISDLESHMVQANLDPETIYYWHVRYQDDQGAWSTSYSTETSFAPDSFLPEGAIAYWKLDDTVGSDAVDSIGSNTGTLSGATWSTTDKKSGDSAAQATADGQRIYATVSGLPSGSEPRTIETWFKPTSDGTLAVGAIFGYPYNGYGGGNNQWFEVKYSHAGDQKFGFHLYATHHLSTNTFAPNNWYHLVATYDGYDLKLYVDGELEIDVRQQLNTSVNASGANFNILGEINWSPDSVRPGIIDEVVVYNRALSENEVKYRFDANGNTPDQPTHSSPGNGTTVNTLTPTLEASSLTPVDQTHLVSRWQVRGSDGVYGAAGSLDTGTTAADLTSMGLDPDPAWGAPGWSYRRKIVLSPVTPAADHPVRIELTPDTFDYTKTKAAGEDIRFYESDGTLLDYFIDKWDTSGTSILYAKVATASTDTIYMYYGNSSASDASTSFSVRHLIDTGFEKSSDFSGTWEMKRFNYWGGYTADWTVTLPTTGGKPDHYVSITGDSQDVGKVTIAQEITVPADLTDASFTIDYQTYSGHTANSGYVTIWVMEVPVWNALTDRDDRSGPGDPDTIWEENVQPNASGDITFWKTKTTTDSGNTLESSLDVYVGQKVMVVAVWGDGGNYNEWGKLDNFVFNYTSTSEPTATLGIEQSDPVFALEYGNTYYWRVQYMNSVGVWSLFSDEWSFTTRNNTKPNTPSAAGPASPVSTRRAELSTNGFSDPDDPNDGHTASRWRVSLTSGDYTGDNLVHDSTVITTGLTAYEVPVDLAPDTTYYWQAQHRDTGNLWSDWSTEASFTTAANLPPHTPGNISPMDGESGISRTPSLVASAFVDDGDGHQASQWQISTGSGVGFDAGLVYDSGATTDLTDHDLTVTLPAYSTLYWRVRYQDDQEAWSEYSDDTSFEITPPDPPSGVTAHWKMNTGILSWAYDSVGDNHGALTGDTSWTSGVSGYGLAFDGDGDYVGVVNSSDINPTSAITVEVWAKSNSATWSNTGCLVSKRAAYILNSVIDSTEVSFAIYNPSNYKWAYAKTVPSIDITKWHHYVGTYDGSKIRLYIDGRLMGTTFYSGSIPSDTGPMYMGWDDGQAGRYLDGFMDEVLIYDRALSGTEVRERYNNSRGDSAPDKPNNSSPSGSGVSLTPNMQVVTDDFSDPDGDSQVASRWQVRKSTGTYGDVNSYDSGVTATDLESHTLPQIRALAVNTTYAWHVQYKDSSGMWSPWSDETTFTTITTNAKPGTPTAQSPTGTIDEPRPDFTSSGFNDPGDTHIASRWRISTVSGSYSGDDLFHDSSRNTSALLSYSLPIDLSSSTTYYWQVQHQDLGGLWSDWSPEATFTTAANLLPNTPVNVSPSAGARISDRTPTLTASAYSDADSDPQQASQWQIATDSGFVSVVYDSGAIDAATSHDTPMSLTAKTTYYWRARYQDNQGNWSEWSAGTSFYLSLYQQEGIIAHWRFDEGAGSDAENSVNPGTYDGTVENTVSWETSGKFGKALNFNGTDTYVSTTLAIDQGDTPSKSYTFLAWAKPSDTVGDRYVVSTDNGGADWSVLIDDGFWTVFSGSGRISFSTMVADIDEWQHVAAVYDSNSNEVTFYKNGVAAPDVVSIDYENSSNKFTIGKNPGYSGFFKGVIDEVVVYAGKALTAEEIREQYNSTAPAQPTNGTPLHEEDSVGLRPTLSTSAFSDPDPGDFHAASRWQIRKSTVTYGDADSFDSGVTYGDLTQISPATDLQYKRSISLSPTTPVDNFQVKITLTTANTNNYANINGDGSDLRFYDAGGVKLPYWIETWNTGGDSFVWVKVVNASTDTIYMLYGDSLAVSESNADNVFEFYDDFSDTTLKSGWAFHNPGGDDSYSLTDNPGWMRIKVVGDSDTWTDINTAPFLYWDPKIMNQDYVVTARQDGTNLGVKQHAGIAVIRSLATSGTKNRGYFGAYNANSAGRVWFAIDGDPEYECDTGGVYVKDIRFRISGTTLYYDWSTDGGTSWNSCNSYTLPSVPKYWYWGLMGKSWGGGGSFDADYDYFHVRKYAASEPGATVGAQSANDLVSQLYTFVKGATYFWRVQYMDSFGVWSPFSDETSFDPDGSVPDDPTGLSAITNGTCRIDLSWTDASDNETYFHIERCVGMDCNAYTELATVGPGVENYSDTSVIANEFHSYRVYAVNTAGFSGALGPDPNPNREVTSLFSYYQDADSDSYGNNAVTQADCSQPEGYVLDNTDCDDTSAEINPITEWYLDGDGDGYSDGTNQPQCADPGENYYLPSELFATSGDCDDSDSAVNPATVWYQDADGDLYSSGITATQCTDPGTDYSLAADLTATSGDCNDSDGDIKPGATEACDGVDNDCDSQVDEGFAKDYTYYRDADNDTYGDLLTTIASCLVSPPSGYVDDIDDCNDNSAAIKPGAVEYCNDVDDDCDGDVDDSCVACDDITTNAPSSVVATALNSKKIELEWIDNSDCEDGFEIEIKLWNGEWVTRATVGPAVTTYIDTEGIMPETQYTYRVRAYQGLDKSSYATSNQVTTPAYSPGDTACD